MDNEQNECKELDVYRYDFKYCRYVLTTFLFMFYIIALLMLIIWLDNMLILVLDGTGLTLVILFLGVPGLPVSSRLLEAKGYGILCEKHVEIRLKHKTYEIEYRNIKNVRSMVLSFGWRIYLKDDNYIIINAPMRFINHDNQPYSIFMNAIERSVRRKKPVRRKLSK